MRKHLYIPIVERDSLSRAESFDGIVVGSEYCAFLIPDARELEEAARWSESCAKELIILFPYLREHQIEELSASVRKIAGRVRPRIAFNDWGTMHVLKGILPEADLVLGRLISGQKACVRIENSPFLTREGKQLLYGDLFSSEKLRYYFQREFGITEISVSAVPDEQTPEAPYKRLVHFPYTLTTVTDYCPYRENLSSGLISSCQRMCRKGYVVLYNDSLGQAVYQRGRGRFFNPFPDGCELPDTANGEIIVYDDVP